MFETPRYRRPGSIILALVLAMASAFYTFSRKQSSGSGVIDPQIDEKAIMTALRLIGWYEQTQDVLAGSNQPASSIDQSVWEQMMIAKGAIEMDTGRKVGKSGPVDAWGNRVVWRPTGVMNSEYGWSLLSLGQNGQDDGGTGDDMVMNAEILARSKKVGVLRSLKKGFYERNER